MSLVVSDTSPIVALAQLGRLEWLEQFFGEVLVPPAVVAELQKAAWRGIVGDALDAPHIRVKAPTDRAHVDQLSSVLDPGEAEALALAVELHADAVLIDEAQGREVAQRLGLTTVGVLGLMLRAKKEGLLAAVRPELERLQSELGFHLSQRLFASILKDAGE